MISQYKKDLQDWHDNPSQETYTKLCDDINYFTESKDSEETLLILEAMLQVLSTDLCFPYEEENIYQLCLDKFDNINFPSKDDTNYNDIIEHIINLLTIFKQEEEDIDQDQLFDVIFSVVVKIDNLSASNLYYTFEDHFGADWLAYSCNNDLINAFLDIATWCGDTSLGIDVSNYSEVSCEKGDYIWYKLVFFEHLNGYCELNDLIQDFHDFLNLFEILNHTPYSNILFDAFKGVFPEGSLNSEYDKDLILWLYDKFKEFKSNQDDKNLNYIIKFALKHIEFKASENKLDKDFSFDILKKVVELHKPEFFNLLRETDQIQYVTSDKLYFLKENIENDNQWADEVAKILLKKSSYKKFLKIPSEEFLKTQEKESLSTSSTIPSDNSKTKIDSKSCSPKDRNAKNSNKKRSKKTSYRPKGIKGKFYGLYKFIHGKKK